MDIANVDPLEPGTALSTFGIEPGKRTDRYFHSKKLGYLSHISYNSMSCCRVNVQALY